MKNSFLETTERIVLPGWRTSGISRILKCTICKNYTHHSVQIVEKQFSLVQEKSLFQSQPSWEHVRNHRFLGRTEGSLPASDTTRMALGGASVNKASPSSAAGMKRKSEPTMKGKAKKEESSEESRCSSVPHLLCRAGRLVAPTCGIPATARVLGLRAAPATGCLPALSAFVARQLRGELGRGGCGQGQEARGQESHPRAQEGRKEGREQRRRFLV